MRQHFVCRRPTGIYSVETVSDSLLNCNRRQEYRNAKKQIVSHVDTVMPCTLGAVVIHITMPSRTSEIPCEVIRVGFSLRDEACVKWRYYPILCTRVSVEWSEWGGRGLAGVVHEIPCTDDIVTVRISIHGDALVEKVSLRYQPEFCGVRDDVLDFPVPIPARNFREEVAEFNDIPFLGIFAHIQTPPENLFNDSSFMLLEEFYEFALGVNPIAHKKQQIGDSVLLGHLREMKVNLGQRLLADIVMLCARTYPYDLASRFVAVQQTLEEVRVVLTYLFAANYKASKCRRPIVEIHISTANIFYGLGTALENHVAIFDRVPLQCRIVDIHAPHDIVIGHIVVLDDVRDRDELDPSAVLLRWSVYAVLESQEPRQWGRFPRSSKVREA